MTATIDQPVKVRRPRATLQLLRIALVVHAVLVIAQPVAAGYFLAGNVDAMTDIHATVGGSVWMSRSSRRSSPRATRSRVAAGSGRPSRPPHSSWPSSSSSRSAICRTSPYTSRSGPPS